MKIHILGVYNKQNEKKQKKFENFFLDERKFFGDSFWNLNIIIKGGFYNNNNKKLHYKGQYIDKTGLAGMSNHACDHREA